MIPDLLSRWRQRSAKAEPSDPASIDEAALARGAEAEEYEVGHEQAVGVALKNLKEDPHCYDASVRARWLQRRVASNVEEMAAKVFSSFKRDMQIGGLDQTKALEHAVGNWQMGTNMRRSMDGQPELTQAEIDAVRARAQQMISGEGGGMGEMVIAHALPMIRGAGDDQREMAEAVVAEHVLPELYRISDLLNSDGIKIRWTGIWFVGSRVKGTSRSSSDFDFLLGYEVYGPSEDVQWWLRNEFKRHLLPAGIDIIPSRGDPPVHLHPDLGPSLKLAHAINLVKTANDAKRDSSCVMANIEDAGIKEAFAEIVASLPDEDIYDPPDDPKYGREENMHVTVKYGLHTDDVEDVRPLVEDFGPIEAEIKGVSFFRAKGKEYDVLKFDIESEDLARLRKKIEGALPSTDEYKIYHPHATIAYLKRGTAEKYADDKVFADLAKSKLGGTALVFDSVCFSDKDGKKETISVAKTASAQWLVHVAKKKANPAYEKETALIRENKKKPEAKKKHDFKPAKWTFPNGHPRCLLCGAEEIIGGVCNKTPTAKDYADFEAELDAEFPGRVERREKREREAHAAFERGEVTHSDLIRSAAMADAAESLAGAYYQGAITQADMESRLRDLRST